MIDTLSNYLECLKIKLSGGGNYFQLPPTKHFIFWDKMNAEGMSFSDGEMAWTSFNKAIRKFTFRNIFDGKIHPTQKPVQLYKWLLKNYAKPEFKLLDTHGGSMSSVIAAYDFGISEMVCCEIDKEYFEAGKKRFEIHKMQQKLF